MLSYNTSYDTSFWSKHFHFAYERYKAAENWIIRNWSIKSFIPTH